MLRESLRKVNKSTLFMPEVHRMQVCHEEGSMCVCVWGGVNMGMVVTT